MMTKTDALTKRAAQILIKLGAKTEESLVNFDSTKMLVPDPVENFW